MMERIKAILESAPIDMEDILAMEATAGKNSGAVLLAGSANAAVLSLMEGIGFGKALAAVEQPCTLICSRGEADSIVLHGGDGSVKCTSAEDLAQRLMWAENCGASVEISCKGDLLGREKLIFAILDPEKFREQLNSYAVGCSAAVIVMNGTGAPHAATVNYAEWLSKACGLGVSTSVFFCDNVADFNCIPATLLALKMGVNPPLKHECCNPAAEGLEKKLRKVVSEAAASVASEEGLAAEMARRAVERLERALKELQADNAPVPSRKRLPLAECFRAEIPGVRARIGTIITDTQRNNVYEDVRKFAIFLQKNIEEVFVEDLLRLDDPKAAARAFAPGYLGFVLSAYCEALINELCRQEIGPCLEKAYQELLDGAWIHERIKADELPESALEAFNVAAKRPGFKGETVVGGALQMALGALFATVAGKIANAFIPGFAFNYIILPVKEKLLDLTEEIIYKSSTPEKYARRAAGHLGKVLDDVAKQFQQVVKESMIPQVEAEILHWFDRQTEQFAKLLEEQDAAAAAAEIEKAKERAALAEKLDAIRSTQEALYSCIR